MNLNDYGGVWMKMDGNEKCNPQECESMNVNCLNPFNRKIHLDAERTNIHLCFQTDRQTVRLTDKLSE